MYALGIDLGTTFTAAAVERDGRAEISALGSRGAAIPSVVVLREDETIITGETASRRALSSPDRVAREFKRRLGDTTPILLGGVPYSAEALMGRVLRAVVAEVSAREGGPPSSICVSHPANWGPYKTDLLQQAVRGADLEDVSFTSEPVAAAVFYAGQQRIPDGAVVAVYDLGGGTFDAAVLRKSAGGFAVLGRPEGIERLGGIDFDAAVFGHVARALDGALEDLDDEDPATISAVARLKEECTAAKEALSSDTDTTIPVLLPGLTTEVRLTRAELESMVRPALQDSIDALRRALRSAGVGPEELHSVLLVGGSSRMPIVSQLVGAELGRPVAVDAHPKHAVALGSALLAAGVADEAPAPAPPVPAPAPASVVAPVVAPEREIHDTQVIAAVPAEPPAEPEPAPARMSYPAPPPTKRPARAGAGRGRVLLAAAAVLVIAAGAAGYVVLTGDDGKPLSGATASTSAGVPADEVCSAAIKANERWVCLTSATFDGKKLTVKYEAEFAGAKADAKDGYHLHIYGGDGTTPAAEVMGKQSLTPGQWYVEDQEPSVRTATSKDYRQVIGDAPKVCARIATAKDLLVADDNGTFVTGNCIPIQRS